MEPATANKLLLQLDALLSVSDTGAIELFDEHADQLHALLSSDYATLERDIRQFNFAAASAALQHHIPSTAD